MRRYEEPKPLPKLVSETQRKAASMRSILLYAIGIPIPIILLLAMCTHHL